MSEKPGWLLLGVAGAREILRDRGLRRKWLTGVLMIDLAIFALGVFVLDEWIEETPWRFLTWWGGCGFLAVMTMVFALYDALAVIREERERL